MQRTQKNSEKGNQKRYQEIHTNQEIPSVATSYKYDFKTKYYIMTNKQFT